MKKLICLAMLLVATGLPAAITVTPGGGAGTFTTNEFPGSAITSGTVGDAYLPATISSDITGNAGGATNLADGTNLFGLMNLRAVIVTNITQNREVLYVTGSGNATIDGVYPKKWFDNTTKQGVWTNTVSTNVCMQNDNDGAYFSVRATTNSGMLYYADFALYPAGSGIPLDYILNPFINDATSLPSAVELRWGTNVTISTNYVITSSNTEIAGLVFTNVLYVSPQGDDATANRTNGIPFRTPFWANSNAVSGDLIHVLPGHYESYSYYMKRGTHMIGSGQATVINLLHENDVSSIYRFQSQIISMTDGCSLGNLVIRNGGIGMTQFDGFYGGTNQYLYSVDIYPHTNTTWSDDQSRYYNVGVEFSRMPDNAVLERVRVFSGFRGFAFDSAEINSTAHTNNTVTLIDCEAYCLPEYAGTNNIWNNGPGGGMQPIAFIASLDATNNTVPGMTVNIQGGTFVSLNGQTNNSVYNNRTNVSRNANIWFASGYDSPVKLNISGNTMFIHGNTNTHSYFILDESTNSSLKVNGQAFVKAVRNSMTDVGTNSIVTLGETVQYGNGNGLTNLLYVDSLTSTNGIFTYSTNALGRIVATFVITNTPVNFAQLISTGGESYDATASPLALTNYNTSSAFGAMVATTTTGVISNLTAGYYRADFAGSFEWTSGEITLSIWTNGVTTHLKHELLGALGVSTSVNFSGVLWLPANCAVAVRYDDDALSADSMIFTLTKL